MSAGSAEMNAQCALPPNRPPFALPSPGVKQLNGDCYEHLLHRDCTKRAKRDGSVPVSARCRRVSL